MGGTAGIATAIGLILGISLILLAIFTAGGNVSAFAASVAAGVSVIIVFGGSFSAILVSFSPEQIINSFKSLKTVFAPKIFPYKETITQIYNMAIIARREGIRGLEVEAERFRDENEVLYQITDMASRTPDPEELRDLMEARILSLKKEHKSNEEVFRKMGGYAPAFGMAGTLIGLIIMLGSLDNPDTIGPSMAVALLTTLYGVLAANLILLPIASKIAGQSIREADYTQMMVEGLLRASSGESPGRLVEKLKTMVPPEEAKEIDVSELRSGASATESASPA